MKISSIRVFPKIMVPPNHPFVHRVFHCKPSILGYPYFLETPILLMVQKSGKLTSWGTVSLTTIIYDGFYRYQVVSRISSTVFWGVLVVGHKTGLVEIFDDIRVTFSPHQCVKDRLACRILVALLLDAGLVTIERIEIGPTISTFTAIQEISGF